MNISTSSALLNDNRGTAHFCVAESVPPEILAAIFKIAQSQQSPSRLRHRLPLEVFISHVSSRWRAVALTTPPLWTRIELYSIKSMTGAAKYLERSSAMSIDIRLDLHDLSRRTKDRNSWLSAVNSIMDMIVPQIWRCRSLLIFTYHEKNAYDIITHLSMLEASALGRLRVNVDSVTTVRRQDPDIPTRFLAGGAPRLQFVETEALHVLPPIANVTTLHLHRSFTRAPISYLDLGDIIKEAPSLANLSIRGAMNTSLWPIHLDESEIQTNALRSLLFDDGPLAIRFLLSVSAPRLESLWLECPFDSFPQFFESPQIAGRNKFPALRYLTQQWTDTYFTKSFAYAFPSVTHFHLSYPNLFHIKYLEDALLNQDIPVWKHLDTIIIRTTRESDPHIIRLSDALIRILPSRCTMQMPIFNLLLDRDLLTYLEARTNGRLGELVNIEDLSSANYLESWWIMSHVNTLDRI